MCDIIPPYTCAVYKAPYLLVYCESGLEVFDVNTAKWIQTIPFKKVMYTNQAYTCTCVVLGKHHPPILMFVWLALVCNLQVDL